MKTKVFYIWALFSFIICNKAFPQLPESLKTVDLGLSSGTLWANMNLGASGVTDYGNYFAWGETTIRESLWFEQDNCPLYTITKNEYIDDDGFTVTETTKGYSKYVLETDASKYGYGGLYDNKTELEREDDAACVLWGESWKLPTQAQWNELVSECTWQPVTLNGTNGYKVIGKNNKYIFLPMGGYCSTSWIKNHIGEYACYWSSSLGYKSDEGYGFTETGNPGSGVSNYRYIGRLIRAVSAHSSKYTLTYLVDGNDYKSYVIRVGEAITPEPDPMKEGYSFSGWSEIPETMPAHDVTVTGTFTINKYKLTYTVDGAEYKTYEVEYGAAITPEAEPTKEGYTFSGWSEIPETMPAHDVTVTGTFSINSYKLTYVLDGQTYKTYDVEYGAIITPEAEPAKDGYTFSGWSEIPETMPAHDMTVTGTFSINKYTLTYMIDDSVYKTVEYEYGATITPEPAPTKEGYTFSGWSEIPETMPAHDVTVTGTFSINKYKLIYTVDGEKYKSYEMEYGATITPEADPTKEGYTFSGWSEIPGTMPAHDVTVTGTFSINKYKLTYTVDGEEYKTYEVEYGATITPEAEPTKEGYSFSGWSEIPETMPAHDVTVTGTFTINKYKLTYIVDGAEYKTYEIEYNATITAEAEPTKEGYTFSGWSEIPETMPAHDVTVTGSFNINSYKLTYMIDDKVYKETMYEYGATIIAEPQPEGDYDTFEWKDLPQTMPAHDVVVYASYTSGIIEVLMASQQNLRIYSPNGKKLNKLQKGLNIVIFDDGTVKKVMMK